MTSLYLVKSDRNKRVGGGGGSVVVSLLPILPSGSDLILYLIKDVFGCQNIFFEIILVQIRPRLVPKFKIPKKICSTCMEH